jgi:hypothetical protein
MTYTGPGPSELVAGRDVEAGWPVGDGTHELAAPPMQVPATRPAAWNGMANGVPEHAGELWK